MPRCRTHIREESLTTPTAQCPKFTMGAGIREVQQETQKKRVQMGAGAVLDTPPPTEIRPRPRPQTPPPAASLVPADPTCQLVTDPCT